MQMVSIDLMGDLLLLLLCQMKYVKHESTYVYIE